MFLEFGFRCFQGRFGLIDGDDHLVKGLRQAADLIFRFHFNLKIEVTGVFDMVGSGVERFERFGTAWDPPIPATVKPAILIIITLVTIQAVSNLIADWNKEDKKHTPADEIDQTEIDNIRKTLEQ